MNRMVVPALSGAILFSGLAEAQSTDSSRAGSASTIPESHVCWRGVRAPACTSFWITEVSVAYPFAMSSQQYAGAGSQLLWTVGRMINRGPTTALGVTVSAGFVQDGNRFSLEGRRRWWASERSGLDLSVGLLQTSLSNGYSSHQDQYGITAGAFAVGGDLIHANAHADFVLTGKPRSELTIGGGFGSQAALVVSILGGLLALAAISSLSMD